jgi:oxygen-independent coproporphyrinogen-3 oxidase
VTLPYLRRIEAGPWFSVGTPLDGGVVEDRLRAAPPRGGETGRYCVYVHVPFCASICSFCALYTRAVPPEAVDVLDEYLDLARRSLDVHPWRRCGQPPTTVHFGGGTPLYLGVPRFAALVHALQDAFGNAPDCEWAIETTTSSLDEDTVDGLVDLGFSRIHLGIQTLDDPTRVRIGRHETGAKAIERIRALEARGLFTSVDLIIGFDGVDRAVVEDDLRRLYDAGVRMFSICELRERGTIRLGVHDLVERAGRNHAIWRMIWDFMASVDLAPIHLGQFGRAQGDNLYFTHPARGESCAAIGPYAHGSAGDMYYGNRLLPDYYEALRAGRSAIGMGVDYAEDARVIRELERDLLAHRVPRATLNRVVDLYPDHFPPMLDTWLRRDLLRDAGDEGVVHTADGSWFVGNMIDEARAMLDPVVQMRRVV